MCDRGAESIDFDAGASTSSIGSNASSAVVIYTEASGASTSNSATISNASSSEVYIEPSESSRALQPSTFDVWRCCNQLTQPQTPLRIVRANYQYLYDYPNNQYLDCVSNVAHVGHCHPAVVRAMGAMDTAFTCSVWDIDYGEFQYPKELQKILPEELDTLLFCDSGSEAVDLALQLSRLSTSGTDVIVVNHAFHGALDSVHQLSAKIDQSKSRPKADWVHCVALPDLYRGQYQSNDPLAVDKYIADAKRVMDSVVQEGKKIACFIAEPMLTIPGCIVPPNTWLKEMYKMVREFGGLCIADEVQTGLGRIGSHYWSFQAHDVTPDILIIGKSLGNGYPMASVVTSNKIAALLGERIREYPCTKMMDAAGCSVLKVLQDEQLMENAVEVGALLKTELLRLQQEYDCIGNIRGTGFMIGIEIVWSQLSKRPAPEIAEQIVQRMRREYIIIAHEGKNRNILLLMPPMCFTLKNALMFCNSLQKILFELTDTMILKALSLITGRPIEGTIEGRLGIVQPQRENDDELPSTSKCKP
ncbi:5-phosphohydroxy-L-lysine phospho-lyase isoform X1 [Procambarus clarkii]|uniref:5-phosphohydroxy-L-lysine phospho-lyase isoform X1 n=1 Tax=Procambarus clarkii TaxID=6728 RepID=UPI0037426C25